MTTTMGRRLALRVLFGLALVLVVAPVAYAHGGMSEMENGSLLDSTFLAQVSGALVGAVAYAIMVWEPKENR